MIETRLRFAFRYIPMQLGPYWVLFSLSYFSIYSLSERSIYPVTLFSDSKSFFKVLTFSRKLARTSTCARCGELGILKLEADDMQDWRVVPELCREDLGTALMGFRLSHKFLLRNFLLLWWFFLSAATSPCALWTLYSSPETNVYGRALLVAPRAEKRGFWMKSNLRLERRSCRVAHTLGVPVPPKTIFH